MARRLRRETLALRSTTGIPTILRLLLYAFAVLLSTIAILWILGAFRFYPYRFIELQKTVGLSVTDVEVPHNLGNVFFGAAVPVSYVLVRDDYRVNFFFQSVHRPNLAMSAIGANGASLHVELRQTSGCHSSYHLGRIWNPPVHEATVFMWGCSDMDYRDKQTIEFVLNDRSGNEVGQEQLAFSIKRNGWYLSLDGI